MGKIKSFYNKYLDKSKKLEDNNSLIGNISNILLFFPAGLISGILVIPLAFFIYPLIIIFKKWEIKISRIGLYIQHTMSFGLSLVIEDYIIFEKILGINEVGLLDFIVCFGIAFIGFYRYINAKVHETLIKTYRTDYKELEKKGIITSSMIRYKTSNGFEEGKLNKKGQKDGLWLSYDDLGKLTNKIIYKNDLCQSIENVE